MRTPAGFSRTALTGLGLLCPGGAAAHVSEQAFVLLLPTGHYILAGCLAVAASILLVSLLPKQVVERLFAPVLVLRDTGRTTLQDLTSCLSFLALACLVWIGFAGPRDPLGNLLPLMLWTGWWMLMVSLLCVAGDLWRWLNPWSGPYRLVFGATPGPPPLQLPLRLGVAPALLLFLAFFGFLIADPAPSDPDRLAVVTSAFWLLSFAGMALFGADVWQSRCDPFTVAFGLLARISPFGGGDRRGLGFPGWALERPHRFSTGLGVFAVALLAAGSFDGLKETFWWLGLIGVNPLEFPGRTAVLASSLLGLAGAVLMLTAAFAATVWAARAIAASGQPAGTVPDFPVVFATLAPAVLPIAMGYHISHFLVSFLIDGQYLLAALGDPLASGANILGLADTRVTTGFLNSLHSVRIIWLTQAGVVVLGHVLSVLVSHHLALKLFQTPRRAALSQIPLGLFMVLYTLFGLWLLATPRGM